MAKNKKSEDRIHQESYLAFHNKYPQYRGLMNYNLNNSPDARTGKKNKEMGLQAGRSDLVFYFKSKAYFLECKTDSGYQSKGQKEWQALVEKHGFIYLIFRTKELFMDIVAAIIKENS